MSIYLYMSIHLRRRSPQNHCTGFDLLENNAPTAKVRTLSKTCFLQGPAARTDNPSGTAELKTEDSGNPKVGALTATCRSLPAPLGFSLSGRRKADASSFAADNSSVLAVRFESQFSLVFTSRALKLWFVRVQEKLLVEEA